MDNKDKRVTWRTKYATLGRQVSLFPESYDYLFKLLIVGDSGVGKTSLLLRFVENKYTESYDFTIGVDFKTKIIQLDGKRIKLYIWDTSGQERFRAITASYYRDAHGVILVYDVTNGKSFHNVRLWLQEAKTHGDDKSANVLIGNKTDLDTKREITAEMGQKYSEELGTPYFETSTKDSINVDAAFQKLVKEMQIIYGNGPLLDKERRITGNDMDNPKASSCLC